MENRKRIVVPFLIGAALSIGLYFGYKISQPAGVGAYVGNSTNSKYQKLSDILTIINSKYVDTVNADKLLEETISEMLHRLDPHSNYIPAEDLKLAKEQINGEFSGVGIRFFILRDTISVTNVIKGSPSYRAGLKSGDRILEVDGKEVAGQKVKNEDVMKMLKGATNSKVKVKVLRGKEKLEYSIVRGAIPIESVTAAYMFDESTGVIRVDQFSMTTAEEFRFALNNLKKEGMKQLILDLRNNPGGVLQAGVEMLDEFISEGKLLLTTKGTNIKDRLYKATRRGDFEQMPLVVLINEGSASASEIVSGALQDNDRALIVGRRSFGKGLVQEDMVLKDGSSLRLTVARYYTPTGRSIQRPYDGDIEEYYHDRTDRYESGELYAPDSSKMVDSLKFKTPKGKVVYGGGGIMPDVFVPLDTTGNTWYLTQLRYVGVFQAFAFDYASDKYNKWKSPQEFNRQFQVTDQLLNQLADYAEKNYEIKKDPRGLARSKERIRTFIKAEIARQIWTENGYFTVLNHQDNEIIAARKALKK